MDKESDKKEIAEKDSKKIADETVNEALDDDNSFEANTNLPNGIAPEVFLEPLLGRRNY